MLRFFSCTSSTHCAVSLLRWKIIKIRDANDKVIASFQHVIAAILTVRKKFLILKFKAMLMWEKKWERLIPQADKSLSEDCVICELYFENDLIERNYKHIINGQEVSLPKGRPTLTGYCSNNFSKFAVGFYEKQYH